MRNLVLVWVALLCNVLMASAQTVFKARVLGQDQQPLVGATVVALEDTSKGTMSDAAGVFSIRLNSGIVQISSVGYRTQRVQLKAPFTEVVLQVSSENLDEVIVSASRERQQRKEVPAAIGVLTAQDIENTKAFGIEQLVNQVPGVFMSTSKAASNEQHFMATRSPISTKSLFLYLEDGIPIRPVAVFNHNALLEMNSTAFQRLEVVKGPASSIYGSEAIGGSFNFITKNPSKELSGFVGVQGNSMGLRRIDLEASTTLQDTVGVYVGAHHVRRINGPVGHSNYEKTAVTFKVVTDFTENLRWTNSINYINYRSDMSGSISEKNYTDGDYQSNQTFTEREAIAGRFRSSLVQRWDNDHKTSFHFIYRDNQMNQIPSYRIRQNRTSGVLNGTGSGEINSNSFKSYVGLIQHKMDWDFANTRVIIGATTDYSPQEYQAEKIAVSVDATTGTNTGYSLQPGNYIMKYRADIYNHAGYAQVEMTPLPGLKLTGALRYDSFTYDYENLDKGNSGVEDTSVSYSNFAPKFGISVDVGKGLGVYSNYSKGFTPPQVGTLFRNGKNKTGTAFSLQPATFHNYEIGAFWMSSYGLKLDAAVYQLDGVDRLISMRDDKGNFIQRNAGKTRSKGVEFGVDYKVLPSVRLRYSGSYATHRYRSFVDNNKDFSNTTMPTAPKYLAMASIAYTPIEDLLLTLEHEQVGSYNTSFEGQAVLTGTTTPGTATYKGHQVVNFKASYRYKNVELWGEALNLFDTLYAVRASYSTWSKQNTYSIGNPRAFHVGIRYNF